MAKIKTEDLIKEIYKTRTISEKEMKLLQRRLNAGENIPLDYEINDDIVVTKEFGNKGLKWLLNQWKTPKGAIRKNNPFGTREMEALNSLKYIEFVGFHNSNWFSRFYVPVYSVVGTKGYFDYYVSGGKINIVG